MFIPLILTTVEISANVMDHSRSKVGPRWLRLGLKYPAVVVSSTVINGSGCENGVSGQQMSTLHSLITTITNVIS